MPTALSPLGQQTDEELIAAYQRGSSEAFELLIARYKNPLTNFVYRFLGNFDECEDVVQETFIRVYRKKHSYRPEARFSTWIYTIAGNLAKTRLRQRDRHKFVSLSPSRKRDGEEITFEVPDTRYAADRQADSTLKNEIIQRALNSISPKFREVVVLRDVQELSYEEIAEVTGLSLGTVKSRINRGRTLLQKLLRDIVEDD